jgi:hypothetical protein
MADAATVDRVGLDAVAEAKPDGSGLLVMMRIVPACELAPYSVPCGPASASTRAMSYMWMSSEPGSW